MNRVQVPDEAPLRPDAVPLRPSEAWPVTRPTLCVVEHLRHRLTGDGLLADQAGTLELRQSLDDLDHRVRLALDEYDHPPTPPSWPT